MVNSSLFGRGVIDDNGPDDGIQQMNSGVSSLSIGTPMPIGSDNIPLSSSISMNPTIGGPYRNSMPQDSSQYHQASPVHRQQNQPQLDRHHFGVGQVGQGPPQHNNNNYTPSSPAGMNTFLNTPISLDGRPTTQVNDPLASFPSIDKPDGLNDFGSLDNISQFLAENASRQNNPSQDLFAPGTPSGSRQGYPLNDAGSLDNGRRDRALSSPGPPTYLSQPSFGSTNPPQTRQSHILYEDKSSSYDNRGSNFPGSNVYRSDGIEASPSINRPPLHRGGTNEALLTPRVEMRHAASDGYINNPSMVPLNMIPMSNNNPGRFPPNNMGSGVIGGSQGSGQLNDRHSFGNIGALNSDNNFQPQQQHYQMPQSLPQGMMPPGMINPNLQQQQGNYLVQQQSPVQMQNMQRQNSTGSAPPAQHFLVNERGEIVGHASPIITQKTFEGYPTSQGPPPPSQPQLAQLAQGQLAQGYSGPVIVNYSPVQPQQRQAPNINPPLQMSGSIGSNKTDPSIQKDNVIIGGAVIGGGNLQQQQQLQRNNTEPIPIVLSQSTVSTPPRKQVSSASYDTAEQPSITCDNNDVVSVLTESVSMPTAVENVKAPSAPAAAAEPLSYAARLMMAPRPQPVVDQTKLHSSATAGSSSANPSGPKMVYQVKFKRSQRNFVLGQRVKREIKIGCYVKVEADRGEDLGIVMGITPVEKFVASTRSRSGTEDSSGSGELSTTSSQAAAAAASISDLKRIMRSATNDEISLLEVKREEEEVLLDICTTKVKQRGLPMTVIDAEYQYDRNKLTFFFQAEGRIDFRELVRDLFSMYKTRIWMEQIDKVTSKKWNHDSKAKE